MDRLFVRIVSTTLLVWIVFAATRLLGEQTHPAAAAQRTPAGTTVRAVPDDLQDTDWLDRLKAAQFKAAVSTDVFHDFEFVDRASESGIGFRNRIVDAAAKRYTAAHYDHGNGIAIADVDGDGKYDVYFANQVGGNYLARNIGGGRFEDITEAAGVAVPGKVSVSASFADIDNDGDPDLFVTTVRRGNSLFENDGHGRFRDISAAAGVNYNGHSSGAVFFDYDRDGLLDLLLVNVGRYTTDEIAGEGYRYYFPFADAFSGHLKPKRAERSILYHNEGGNRFVDATAEAGLVDFSWSGDATVVDVNDDGWPDVYLLNMQGDDQYYENVGGKRFVRRSREVFPKTPWGSMGAKVFDFNNDGQLDIFVTDMHSDMSEAVGPERDKRKSDMKWPVEFRGTGVTSIWGNAFFLKEGPGRYREVSDAINLESYCPWGPSVGDLNADGYDDVFIASGMGYPERYELDPLRLNDHGRRFVDAEFLLKVEPRNNGVAIPFFDVDASGRDKGHKDAGGLTGRATIVGARSSRSAVIFDVEGDGDLDIVTNEFNDVPRVLISNLSEKRAIHYVAVKLTGSTSNRDGLGAVVKIKAGGTTYTKVLDGSSGYLSHGVCPLYFGLGDATALDGIDVVWPSGTRQSVAAPIRINSVIEVREPPRAASSR